MIPESHLLSQVAADSALGILPGPKPFVGLSNAAGAEPTAQLPPASGFERLRVDNTKSEEKS